MNLHFVWHDIQHGLLHFDSGVLFTVKELFTRPGHSIREFIAGKRVRHFKPVSLVIVLATVYGILYHYFDINIFSGDFSKGFEEGLNRGNPGNKNPVNFDLEKVNEWIGTHYSWTSLLLLPFYSLGSFLAFRKGGYNYIEHFVLNAFLTSQRLVVSIVLFPLAYLYNGTTTLTTISFLSEFLGVGLAIWTFIQFFKEYPKWKVFFLALLSYIFFIVSALLFALIAGIVFAVIALKTRP